MSEYYYLKQKIKIKYFSTINKKIPRYKIQFPNKFQNSKLKTQMSGLFLIILEIGNQPDGRAGCFLKI